jgi:signal transduction histidine kinase/putative methionine-R-sulfoxide reductase with GAF domain
MATADVRQSDAERIRQLSEALEMRQRELAILSEVAARIHGEEDVQRILDIALQEILDGLGLTAAWVFTGDRADERLHLAASRGISPAYAGDVEAKGLGDCLCPQVFRSGQRMQVRNATECPRMPWIVEGLHATAAHACIPLRFERTQRGVLNVAARPGELFSDDQLRFLETVGHQVCVAVERAGHLRAERLRNQEARAMAAISKAIGGSLDRDAVLQAVGETAGRVLGSDRAYILLGSDPRNVSVAHLAGEGTGLSEGQTVDLFEMGWLLSAEAMTGRRLMRMDDRDSDDAVDRRAARQLGVAAALAVPLLAHDRVRGVLVLARSKPHHWSEEEMEMAEALAAGASVAIENARLYDEARTAFEAERLRNQEARAMAAISKAIGGTLDVRAVLEAVGRSAREIVGADRVQIYLGADAKQLTVAHLSGLPHPELKEGQALDLGSARAHLQRKALEERQTIKVDDWHLDPRVNRDLASRWGIGSAIILPLAARKRTLGLLVITRRAALAWTEEQLDTAEALAAQASVALEHARLYDDARKAYQDLKDAQQRILQTEKMAVLGTFASGLAHEVRNPLNSIALQLSILERRLSRAQMDRPSEAAEVVTVIRDEIRRLDRLVGDFLLFSRTNRIQYRPVALDPLVEDVVRLLRPEARAAGISIRRQRVGSSLPDLRMDAERVKQVVINLVRNAIEALHQGGHVTVRSGMVDGRARIVVQDDGPGLPEGLDVFQLFVTTKDKGTGLGLSIAQQVVLEHGGEITAASQAGQGATFTISLPIEPADEARPERRNP